MLDEAFSFFEPKENLTPTEWNAKYSYISSEVSSYSGYFNPKLNKYLCEPLDSFDNRKINELIISFGSQTGKSFLLSMGMMYLIWKRNSNILYLMPSDQSAKQMVRERILPLMKNNRLISELFPADDDLVTLHNMKLLNCNLHFNGSGNASKLASFSAPVVLADEVQKFESKSRNESGAVSLSKQRTKAFSKAEQLYVMSSTPTIDDGVESITYHLNRSDYRQFYVPCLECGEMNKINFTQEGTDFFVKFENSKFENGQRNMNVCMNSAVLECACCGATFNDQQKNKMVNDPRSEWRATNQMADATIRGYQLNSLYSFYVTLGSAVKTFLESKDSISGLQDFTNGFMGNVWTPKKLDAPDIISLKELEGENERGELPKNYAFNLLIADVQKYHFWYMVLSITTEGFIHIVDHGKASGFEHLESEKDRYNCEYALVDSRYQTSEVISNLAELGESWIAIRAFDKLPQNVFHDMFLVDSISGKKAKGGGVGKVREFRINLQHYKSLFFRMRNRQLPNLVCYKNMDIELAQHLISEIQLEKTDRNGRKKIIFEQVAKRNDLLDTCVYGISFSYFLNGVKAFSNSDANNGTRKPIQDRVRKISIV